MITPVTKIELVGDRYKANQLSLAHTNRLLHIFRQNNAFQNVMVNSHREPFYDDTGKFIGSIVMQTNFGLEKVWVEVPFGGKEEKEEKQVYKTDYDFNIVIPMLKVYDAPMGNVLGWAVYYTGKLEAGKCFFLEWVDDLPVDDQGIDFVQLGVLLKAIYTPLASSENLAVAMPMYCQTAPEYLVVYSDYGDDLLPPCAEEYPCIDEFEGIPNLTNVAWNYGEDGTKAFLSNNNFIGCDPSWPVDDAISIIETGWIHKSYMALPLRRWLEGDDSGVLVSSEITEQYSSVYTYDPAYFLMEYASNYDPDEHRCWNYFLLYPDAEPGTSKYLHGHCPNLHEIGFWTLQIGNNGISVGDSVYTMQTWYKVRTFTYTISPFTDMLTDGYGWFGTYDPDIRLFFTARGYGNHSYSERQENTSWGCVDRVYLTDPYIEMLDSTLEYNVAYTVGGTLYFRNEDAIASYESSVAASGEDFEDAYWHDHIPDLMQIISMRGSVHYNQDRKKTEDLYHSAAFADACVGIDDVSTADGWPTVKCGAIAFASSETPTDEPPSLLTFPNISLDYQAYDQGAFTFFVWGVWQPIEMEGNDAPDGLVLVTSGNGYGTDRPDLSTATVSSRSWDRFVVRFSAYRGDANVRDI